jgi:hypothetical protein
MKIENRTEINIVNNYTYVKPQEAWVSQCIEIIFLTLYIIYLSQTLNFDFFNAAYAIYSLIKAAI